MAVEAVAERTRSPDSPPPTEMFLTCRAGSARFQRHIRALAAVSPSSVPPPNPNTLGPFQVFDRAAKTIQKDRAAERFAGEASRTVDYIRDEVADRMMERLMVWTLIT